MRGVACCFYAIAAREVRQCERGIDATVMASSWPYAHERDGNERKHAKNHRVSFNDNTDVTILETPYSEMYDFHPR